MKDKSLQFEQFRNEYNEFYYNSFLIDEDNEKIYLNYEFEIPNLTKFNSNIFILKKDMPFKSINSDYVKNMVFHIGLIELISYWKCTCAPNIIIKCGYLDDEQIEWWKKVYFYGLGELFYVNNIKTNINDFVNIRCVDSCLKFDYDKIDEEYSGYIVPIGGGKDSVVTLEILDIDKNKDYCLIINPKDVALNCASIAGFSNNNIIEIYRKIDKRLLDLNSKDYINGHTPFSAMIAFMSYFISYLLSKRYIALSNEGSANESNVVGEKVNHQYSKSYEFECDFLEYSNKYLKAPVKYFSFLRPLNELQIAKIFSRCEEYHSVFKSCNVGSKGKEWHWCCNCAKCLFAYIMLSPYLYKEKLVNIFKSDLYENKDLLNTFIELTGNGMNKPFDCVGTYEEVNYAISKTIMNIDNGNNLPYLLDYYKKNFELVDLTKDITMDYDNNNNLTYEQDNLLRKEVFWNGK